jgi:uncharacterized membrane protein (UPF0127 family)
MKKVLIHNQNNKDMTPVQANYCQSFLCRLRGLTFRRTLPSNQGLLLVQSKESKLDASIHMMFVWTDLAVVWIDNYYQVVDKIMARSWHLAYFPQQPARYILEMNPSRLDDFQIGDKVKFDEARMD